MNTTKQFLVCYSTVLALTYLIVGFTAGDLHWGQQVFEFHPLVRYAIVVGVIILALCVWLTIELNREMYPDRN